MLASLLRLGAVVSVLIHAHAADVPTVKLPNGAKITGVVQTNVAGKQVNAFKGIPYAEAPIGERRWKQTTLKPIATDLNATEYGSICYGVAAMDAVSGQYPPSEDCLFLNVFAPAGATRDSKLPVMVWIHGGVFAAGASNPYDGTNLIGAADQKVVYVSLNYRLGVFGFLSNDEILRDGQGANFGLRDQEVAFQWVKKYIREFGGNPDDITAFGESAGGMSVGLHLISRQGNQQWFKRAILSSGVYSGSQYTASSAKQASNTAAVAAAVGCNSTLAVMSCLRKANASAVFETSATLSFMPTVDKVFLLEPAILRVIKGKISRVPTLIGTNTDEGWLYTFGATEAEQFDGYMRSDWPLLTEAEYSKVKELYPLDGFLTAHHRVAEVFADITFVCPSELYSAVLAASPAYTTYRYHFNQTNTKFGFPLAVHTADNDYVFNRVDNLPRNDSGVTAVVNSMQKLWTNFAKTGNPNGADNKQTTVVWPKYDKSKKQLVIQPTLTTEVNSVGIPRHAERCAFWHEVDLRIAATSLVNKC